jgi:hypothetical protein
MKGFLFALLFVILALAVRSQDDFFGIKYLEKDCADEGEVCRGGKKCCGEMTCSEFGVCRS